MARGDGCDLAAPERGLHACDELAHAEGLGEVVVGADLEGVHLVVLAAARGDDEDRCEDPLAPGLLGQRPAVQGRQHEIDDAHVGSLEAQLPQGALAVLDPLDVVSGMAEVRAHRACDHPVVLHQ